MSKSHPSRIQQRPFNCLILLKLLLANLIWVSFSSYAGDEPREQAAQTWSYSVTNLQYSRAQPFYKLCLFRGSGFFSSYELTDVVPLGKKCEAVFVLMKPHDKELSLDISRSSLPSNVAFASAKNAGLESILNGKIPEMVKQFDAEQEALAKKKVYEQYRQQYSEADSPEKIDEFIQKYSVSDTDDLIPQLRAKAIEIKKQRDILAIEAEQFVANNLAKYAEQEKAEASKKEKLKAIARAESEDKRQYLVSLGIKHAAAIKSLGFSKPFLDGTIYLQADYFNRPVAYAKFRDWLALLFESGNYSNITKISSGQFQGIQLKRPGMQSGGLLFLLDGADLFPSHIVTATNTIRLKTDDDRITVAMMVSQAVK